MLSAAPHGDCFLHVEWRVPAGGAGELAGNSGIKLQGRYEVQILDDDPSVRGTRRGAGAIYNTAAPQRSPHRGPGEWQSYDILFRAARWNGDVKLENARMTVYWNDVLVHDDVPLPAATGVSPPEVPRPMPLLLQGHESDADGDVQFRNVWMVTPPRLATIEFVQEHAIMVGGRFAITGPRLTGSPPTGVRVHPPLPAGLFLGGDGSIKGVPATAGSREVHTITLWNAAGSCSFDVALTVHAE